VWNETDFNTPTLKQRRQAEDKKQNQEKTEWGAGNRALTRKRQRQSGRDSWDGPTGLWREELNFPTPSVTSPWVESSTYVKPPTTT